MTVTAWYAETIEVDVDSWPSVMLLFIDDGTMDGQMLIARVLSQTDRYPSLAIKVSKQILKEYHDKVKSLRDVFNNPHADKFTFDLHNSTGMCEFLALTLTPYTNPVPEEWLPD